MALLPCQREPVTNVQLAYQLTKLMTPSLQTTIELSLNTDWQYVLTCGELDEGVRTRSPRDGADGVLQRIRVVFTVIRNDSKRASEFSR